MGEVIHAAFGTEREWQQTREKTVDGLVRIGAKFGDDETLMRAKAEVVYQMLRQVVENVPAINLRSAMPPGLRDQELALVGEALKHAALKGIEVAMTHSVEVMMTHIYDLCTSRLATDSKHVR
jgi:hypothetical protein